jgi:D-sedoheptulose 7-phosphate isomerase
MKYNKLVRDALRESVAIRRVGAPDIENIVKIALKIVQALKKGGKVYTFGNGGSAADSQHIVAELTGRFKKDRLSLPAEALAVNTSALTALANDYGYDKIFSHIVKGVCKKGDVLIAFSAGGNSPNVVKAILEGKKIGCLTIGFTGKDGGKLRKIADYSIHVKSQATARIQEMHIMWGHIMCEIIEEEIFGQ